MHAATRKPWCQNLKSDFNDGSVAGELKVLDEVCRGQANSQTRKLQVILYSMWGSKIDVYTMMIE
jgi:hypothetical protein